MKKKTIALLLATAMTFGACGSANQSSVVSTTETTVTEAQTTASYETEMAETKTEVSLKDIGDIEVEKELFDVNITIPASYVGNTTQEELEVEASEKGYKAKLNDDGTATYTMTKSQHKKMMDEMTESMEEALNGMIGAEKTPDYVAIDHNKNFTEYTITTKATEITLSDSGVIMSLGMYAGMYGIFNGEEADNFIVTYVNADTNDVIYTYDAKEHGNK